MTQGQDPVVSSDPTRNHGHRHSHRVTIEGGSAFDVDSQEDSLLRAALRAGLAFPYECSVGGCGCCRFELLEGEMDTLWAQAPGLSARDRQRGRRLACQSRPTGDCRIRVRLEASAERPLPARRMTAQLMSRRDLTPDMAEFAFRLPQPTPFRPGQYALLKMPGVEGMRAYSMSDAADDAGVWRFIVRRVPGGQGSTALFGRVAVGQPIEIDGPYGHAWLRPGTRDAVCIAGGSGLGPMLSVARGVLAEGGTRHVHVFLGLRTQDELGAAAELQALAGNRLTATTVLSAPHAKPAWTQATGCVHETVQAQLPQPLSAFDFYFAGPPPMVDAVQQLLVVRHVVPHGQIHFDRFV
jgi:toluene monooxygenase electron transfer component